MRIKFTDFFNFKRLKAGSTEMSQLIFENGAILSLEKDGGTELLKCAIDCGMFEDTHVI